MNMANEIIGREEEIKLLEECYQSGKAEDGSGKPIW